MEHNNDARAVLKERGTTFIKCTQFIVQNIEEEKGKRQAGAEQCQAQGSAI